MLAHFSLQREHDVRKHIYIDLLMDTQMLMISIYDDDYEGNHINYLYARDILGHKKYLDAIEEMKDAGILNRQEKFNEYKQQYHFYDPMDLTYEKEYTLPSTMKKVNNSIDRLINRKLDNFSEEGKIILKNLQDTDFNINCSHADYEKYYSEHYPDYCESKKYKSKRGKDGKNKKCVPLPFADYQKQYEITWNIIHQFLDSDRSKAWRYIVDNDNFAHRIYSIATGCSKFLRQHFTYKGENVSILDLKQSGPTFLAKILQQWHPGNDYSKFIKQGNNLYKHLMKKFNEDRERAKRIYNIWAYGDIDCYYYRRMEREFPGAYAVMNQIKTMDMSINPKPENYKNLAYLIFQEESRVFRMIWNELDKEIGWFLTCHDEIIVPESKKDQAYQIMFDILSQELGNIPFEIRHE